MINLFRDAKQQLLRYRDAQKPCSGVGSSACINLRKKNSAEPGLHWQVWLTLFLKECQQSAGPLFNLFAACLTRDLLVCVLNPLLFPLGHRAGFCSATAYLPVSHSSRQQGAEMRARGGRAAFQSTQSWLSQSSGQ